MGTLLTKGRSRSSASASAKSAAVGGGGSKLETLKEQADSMQEVLPGIFMGAAAASENRELLRKHGVTHVLAIGWDLSVHFPSDFSYLLLNGVEDRPNYFILQHFSLCFAFMDDGLKSDARISASDEERLRQQWPHAEMRLLAESERPKAGSGRVFVHCHKGLSRSASVIIGYQMRRTRAGFDAVLDEIRRERPFILPNIGFQAQLLEFENQSMSLDMSLYSSFDISKRISALMPRMLAKIEESVAKYESEEGSRVSEASLFELTMYFHQVDMLYRSGKLALADDQRILDCAIKLLLKIQTDYVRIDSSLAMFELLFNIDRATGLRRFSDKELTRIQKAKQALAVAGELTAALSLHAKPIDLDEKKCE